MGELFIGERERLIKREGRKTRVMEEKYANKEERKGRREVMKERRKRGREIK